ncbi:MAG: methylated-DNA--[protein]-cysteine S-methyltransferase [Lachnospiraceae bacterium]|nr:methylated-DNA--[protein]-cysteine S-methyltransferase [Lachnospiraceae bacterium]
MDLVKKVEEFIFKNYKVKPEHPWHQYPQYETFKEMYSGKWFAIVMNVGREKLGIAGNIERYDVSLGYEETGIYGAARNEPLGYEETGIYGAAKNEIFGDVWIINVKADTDFISMVAGTNGYLPAYHMSKKNWITILLDGTVSLEEIKARIADSYQMISDTPTKRIYEAVKKIPKGKVATYGKVAEMAGNPKMSRAVGNALHKNPDPENIPCYRVVNSKGELAEAFVFGGDKVQQRLLEADGVEVVSGKVDLSKFGL